MNSQDTIVTYRGCWRDSARDIESYKQEDRDAGFAHVRWAMGEAYVIVVTQNPRTTEWQTNLHEMTTPHPYTHIPYGVGRKVWSIGGRNLDKAIDRAARLMAAPRK